MTQRAMNSRPGTADFIREHLRKVGQDYGYRMWKTFCRKLQEAGKKPSSYDSFRKHIYNLSKMKLIEFSRSEPEGKLIPRRYYQLVKRNFRSEDWNNPRAALDRKEGRVIADPVSGNLLPKSGLGTRRYNRLVKKSPAKPVGRPKKPLTP
jgi:hypothetical protein